ncbi:high mobility group-T protein-like [Stylophora pistillata]|uniref:high mobility group-T protein-like n=1 Tax=Stylophora pistillata TaxID=50429 RepID=UPI000C03DB19|nr:high mobility group-T protein-like [Stylophora pistillata]
MAAVNGESVHEESQGKSSIWTYEKEQKLFGKVDEYLEDSEERRGFYVKDINWSDIAFDGFTADEVHKRWRVLTLRVRKMRNAKEILEDAKQRAADKQTSEGSRKRKMDDSFPKAPLTAYLLFSNEKRQPMAEKYPDLNTRELLAKIGKKWRKLSAEKKKKYQDIYLEDKKKYESELTQYFLTNFPEEKAPKTAFELWSAKKEKELKEEHPNISDKRLQKKLKKRWGRLDDEEKEELEKKSKQEMDKFLRKMRKRVKV